MGVTTPGTVPAAPHLPPPPPPHLFGLVVPPIILPVFLAAADSTVVATALPAIAAAFGNVEYLSWIVVANLVASAVAAPAYGRLGDAFGRRRMMMAAVRRSSWPRQACAPSPIFGCCLSPAWCRASAAAA